MPQFCRHNRLLQSCPICSREQAVDLRPVVSSSAPRSTQGRPASRPGARGRTGADRGRSGRAPAGMKVRRLRTAVDDGYRSPLVPGLKSSEEAARLADELAFAAGRLGTLASDPPGLYAEVADPGTGTEERTWLALLIAYLGPLDDQDPFAAIRAVRTTWSSGELPMLDGVTSGPRAAYDPALGTRTLDAYRAWAGRAGSQAAAFSGQPEWTPERRFARSFERLALPGMHRDARFELLVSLGRLGVYELRAGALMLGGSDQVTVAAKRALGIGDTMLLERRAAQLADGCGIPLEALDLGFYNWERGERATGGMPAGSAADPALHESVRGALGA
jgi:hypothetical protein